MKDGDKRAIRSITGLTSSGDVCAHFIFWNGLSHLSFASTDPQCLHHEIYPPSTKTKSLCYASTTLLKLKLYNIMQERELGQHSLNIRRVGSSTSASSPWSIRRHGHTKRRILHSCNVHVNPKPKVSDRGQNGCLHPP